MYYKGFYIDKPIGNNEFSYIERKNKKIYIPPLKEGDLNDVKVGNNIAFSEIEEYEINTMGLDCFVKYNYKGKDVYIFDNHNHAFYFWVKGIHENKFVKGIMLVHVDQHKDTREPKEYIDDIDDLKKVFKYTNYILNVGNFMKPALNINIFNKLIIMDNEKSFYEEINEDFVLDIDLDIFSSDMDYISYDLRMKKIKGLVKKSKFITIATSPFFINQEKAIKILKEIFEEE